MNMCIKCTQPPYSKTLVGINQIKCSQILSMEALSKKVNSSFLSKLIFSIAF